MSKSQFSEELRLKNTLILEFWDHYKGVDKSTESSFFQKLGIGFHDGNGSFQEKKKSHFLQYYVDVSDRGLMIHKYLEQCRAESTRGEPADVVTQVPYPPIKLHLVRYFLVLSFGDNQMG